MDKLLLSDISENPPLSSYLPHHSHFSQSIKYLMYYTIHKNQKKRENGASRTVEEM